MIMMRFNYTSDYSRMILVVVNISGTQYRIGRITLTNEQMEDIYKVKEKFMTKNYTPTDEFAKLIKSKIEYLNEEEIAKAEVEFIYLDNYTTIDF